MSSKLSPRIDVAPSHSSTEAFPTKSPKEVAFTNLQIARDAFELAKRNAASAHADMVSARHAMQSAKTMAKKQRQSIRAAKALSNQIWLAYDRERDEILAKINTLHSAATTEHEKMLRCYNRARVEHGSFDQRLAEQGHRHAARRDELNREIEALRAELDLAKHNAKLQLPIIDYDAFKVAKKAAEEAIAAYQVAESYFHQQKSERERAEQALSAAKQAYLRSQNASTKPSTVQALTLATT